MPDWLPPLIEVSPWKEDTFDRLYEIFCRDIRNGRLNYLGNPVNIFNETSDGKENIFWHLTTRTDHTTVVPRRKQKFFGNRVDASPQRLPDLRRCERFNWIKAIIEHAVEPEVTNWDHLEADGTEKTYLWMKKQNFVVIMKKFPNHNRRLVTSFYVDSQYTINKFEKKYENRMK
ncbi:hypothetical protein EH221_02030 [bacterium]|nr:MAG: hypothetical protein EH221_02030 [bacterium]